MKKIRIILFIGISLITVSAAFLLFPTISNLINSIFNNSTISNYSESVKTLSENVVEDEFSAANEYNRKLSDSVGVSYSTKPIVEGYDKILNFDGIIGYIEIPKIDVKLPIYHGTDDSVLTKGAAHLPNSSFPTGGTGNHAVLTAHTGYPTQVFFDNLPDLTNGDLIYINILDEQLTYKVCDINIVDPDDISFLQVDENRNLLSLVTCYPYAVNSHRLIVTAEEYINSDNKIAPTEKIENNSYTYIVIALLALLLLAVLILTVIKVRKGREANA